MSAPINTGGPAFPLPPVSHHGKVVAITEGSAQGMTLRDYFAARAMQEMKWHDEDHAAQACYEIADAMLRAREA